MVQGFLWYDGRFAYLKHDRVNITSSEIFGGGGMEGNEKKKALQHI